MSHGRPGNLLRFAVSWLCYWRFAVPCSQLSCAKIFVLGCILSRMAIAHFFKPYSAISNQVYEPLLSKILVLLVESMDLIGKTSLRCLILCKSVPFPKIFGRDIASFVRILFSKKDILS